MNKKAAVIGIGNTLRRDDGIGIIILEFLLSSFKQEGIEYLNFGIASFDLVHRMQAYDTILLIDGIDGALAPGALKIFELTDSVYSLKDSPISTHEFNLKSLFDLYKKLGLKTRIYVAGIQVKNISYGEGLSPQLKSRRVPLTQEISLFINKTLLCA